MYTPFKLREIPGHWKNNTYGLEFECQYRDRDIRQALLNKYYGFFYITQDESLDWMYGLEIVSQPLSLPVLIKQLQKMKKKMSEVRADGNGAIHIHIPKTQQNLKTVQFIADWIWNTHRSLIAEFSGRRPNEYCRISRAPGYYERERYSWINLTRNDTIEFRGFANSGLYFGWEWSIIALKRLDYLLRHPTEQGMKEAISLFPWKPEPTTILRHSEPLTLRQILRNSF